MSSVNRSKLVKLTVRNIGCVGNEGLEKELDNIVCLVGKNNAGKSTVLRAYELAKGSESFTFSRDRHLHAIEDQPSEVILDVHIPDGIGNVDGRWKIDSEGLRIVRSRWQWAAPNFLKVRTTWDPTGGDASGCWAEDGKAGGADPVFTSRLPRPLRIGSLEDAAKSEESLLTLALAPLLANLEKARQDAESSLAQAISKVTGEINNLSSAHEEHFNVIADKVSNGFQGVFPSLDVKLSIGAAPLVPKVDQLVKSGSGLRVRDGAADTSLSQQGAGARRALFWAMLQVHNEITRNEEVRSDYKRQVRKDLAELEKKCSKAKMQQEKDDLNSHIAELTALLAAHEEGAPIPASSDDPALPGYLLLIDEPENALHPMAARAAQRHLYKLAESPDWQVMLTTHSPYFVNPFEDHTTIVRLDRPNGDPSNCAVQPKTYRSDSIDFGTTGKQRLQALQQIDPSFSEIFFGSYPILVEGDTEHAAFIAAILERKKDLQEQVTLIRSRGKAILVPLIKILKHFKIDFGIIHDCDPPYRGDGCNNGMWSENGKIYDAIEEARKAGVTVRHRVSIPDFERFLGGDEESKDKPLNAYCSIVEDDGLKNKVTNLLTELLSHQQHKPLPNESLPEGADYLMALKSAVTAWASDNGLGENIRYTGAKNS